MTESKILLARPENYPELTLSVSKVKTFKDCKAKFKYAYIEKLPRKDWDFHILGKFLHEILENFYKAKIEKEEITNNALMTRCLKNAYLVWKEKISKEQFIESKDILARYLILLTEEKNPPTILAAEKSFYIEIDNKILLNGFIDRTQLDYDDVLHVSDYKTTKNKKYLKNDFFQLLTYAYVMLLEDPSLKKVRTSYILLRHNFESIVKEFSRDEIMKVEDILLDWADKINSEKLYRPNPNFLCNYCEFAQPNLCLEGYNKVAERNPQFGEVSW